MKKVLVLVLVAVVGYFVYQGHQKKKAAGMLQEVRTLIEEGEFDEAKVLLADLLLTYHWTESASSAEELYGNIEEMRRDHRRQAAKEERARQRKEDEQKERLEKAHVVTPSRLEAPPTPWAHPEDASKDDPDWRNSDSDDD